MPEKEQPNFTTIQSPEQKIKEQKEITATAESNVEKSLEALDRLGINMPERHNVLVPGTPTSPENSKLLLQKAIEEDGEIGVYLGVTVCPYICKFCRYYNRTGPLKDLDKMAASDIDDITREMEIIDRDLKLSKKPKTSSVYVGGGTPTLMSKESMQIIFENLHKFYNIEKDAEITMECTPDTVDEEKIKTMKNFGVNRISMGVQRLNDEWLKSMNRRHSASDVLIPWNYSIKIRFNLILI